MTSRVAIFYLAAGLIGAVLAHSKGRSPYLWFGLSVLLPLMVVVLYFLPPVPVRGVTKRCPNCRSVVSAGAGRCETCGTALPIDLVQCPKCGKYVSEATRCEECGERLVR